MQANVSTLASLNACLMDQLTAINQLFLHARMAGSWGLGEFNESEYKRSIDAMKMADTLIERILFLEGLPNLQELGKLFIGEDVPEMLGGDLRMQTDVRSTLVNAIKQCEDDRDYVSRDIMKCILSKTEEHIDWIESQQWLIENSGVQNYLQSQMED